MIRPLLTTKLYVPRTRPQSVPRRRLIERLNEGRYAKLVLVSAPAGSGKTTLLSEWVVQLERPACWVSLGEEDNAPAIFWEYFVGALQTIQEGVGQAALAPLRSSREHSVEPRLVDLINDVAGMPAPFVLILDDYHSIEDQGINSAMTFLLEHLPAQMQVVIATRADPPLPISRLRGRNQLIELCTADLNFTFDEAARFLKVMGLNLASKDIAILEARTEGWITGLQMAALSMQGQSGGRVADFVAGFTGSHRHVLRYLLQEVLQQQPDDIRAFLLRTAILDRLSGPLCDAVLQPTTPSQGVLERLERANLFVVPLDDEQRWYRYHHLFGDLLRSRLEEYDEEEIAVLHRRASDWYEQNDLISQAVHHALAGRDIERVEQLVGRNVFAMMGHSELAALERWLAALPEEMVRSRPWLSVAQGCVLVQTGRPDLAEALVERAEQALRHDADGSAIDRRLTGSIAAVRMSAAYQRGDVDRARDFGRQALDILPADDLTARRWVMTEYAASLFWGGDFTAADQAFAEASAAPAETGDIFVAVMSLCELGLAWSARCRLGKAIEFYRTAIRMAEEHARISGRQIPAVGYAHIKLVWLLRERNDLSGAMEHIQEGMRISRMWGQPNQWVIGCINLALMLHTVGDVSGGLDVLEEARQVVRRGGAAWHLPQVEAREALIRLRTGDLAAALRWVEQTGLDLDGPYTHQSIDLYRIAAEILVAQGRKDPAGDALDRVLRLLARLTASAEAAEWWYYVAWAQILLALAWQAKGNTGSALTHLEQALALCEPEGCIRIFVDLGAPMGELLHEAAKRGIAIEYVGRLLAALAAQRPAPSGEPSPRDELIEPLTRRELEVLHLVAGGSTNKEIAGALNISVTTAKKHVQNIHGKLDVHSRTGAVDRARKLGLI